MGFALHGWIRQLLRPFEDVGNVYPRNSDGFSQTRSSQGVCKRHWLSGCDISRIAPACRTSVIESDLTPYARVPDSGPATCGRCCEPDPWTAESAGLAGRQARTATTLLATRLAGTLIATEQEVDGAKQPRNLKNLTGLQKWKSQIFGWSPRRS